jgi:flagellar basal-body rod protein FlgF
MNKFIFLAANAAKNAMARQDSVANNLANVNTPAFKAQLLAFRAAPVVGEGLPARAFAVESTTGADFTPGPIMPTGRNLDVAIQGSGWLSVQGRDGKEAYTRDGSLQLDAQGNIVNLKGQRVLGEGGPLTVPPDHAISVEGDGSISATPLNGNQNNVIQVGKLKLVNPDSKQLIRGEDGLFRTSNGRPAQPDAQVKLTSGSLEGSNVSAIDAMVQMISAARQFDLQLKMVTTSETNARAANQLFSGN